MKRMKRMIALVLSVALIVTLLPASTAFADSQKTFSYVSIGDSAAAGCGLDGYTNDNRGFNIEVEDAYPALIQKKLEAQYGAGNVNLHRLAGSALRPNDLDAILNEDHVNDDFTNRVFDGYDKANSSAGEHWFVNFANQMGADIKMPVESQCKSNADYLQKCKDASNEAKTWLRNEYVSALTGANLVTYNLGANSFGIFISNAFTSGRRGDTDTLEDLAAAIGLDKSTIDLSKLKSEFLDAIKDNLGDEVDAETVEEKYGQYADVIAQAFVGFCYYFDKNIESIREHNSDCDIVIVGLKSYFKDLKITLEGQEFEIGNYYNYLLGLANTYMALISDNANDDHLYFADLNDAEITTFFDELVSKNLSDEMQQYLDEFIGQKAKDSVGIEGMETAEIGKMLKRWYKEGYTKDSDWTVLAQVAESQGMVSEKDKQTLQGVGLSVADTLKLAWLYYNKDDAFVEAICTKIPLLKGYGYDKETKKYKSFKEFTETKMVQTVFKTYGLTTKFTEIGKELKATRQYGRMEEMIISCASKDPVACDKIITMLSDGFNMSTIEVDISSEIISALENGDDLRASTKALLNLYLRILFPDGSGFSVHPNASGHKTIANIIWKAYTNKTKASDKAKSILPKEIKGILQSLYDLAEANGVTKVDSYCDWTMDTVNSYAVLGDSTVFGFGLEGYGVNDANFTDNWGYGVAGCSKDAYPMLLKNALNISDENFYQLSMATLRIVDLRVILDESFAGDDYTKDYILDTINTYGGGLDNMRRAYRNAIEGSDFITVGIGGNDMGSFAGNQMQKKTESKMDLSQYGEFFTDINDTLHKVVDLIKEKNPDADIDDITKAGESEIYALATAFENYEATFDKIHSMNPDAKVAIVGLYNPVKTAYYTAEDGTKIDLGGVADLFVAAINTKYQEYAMNNSDWCAYVDASGVEPKSKYDKTCVPDLSKDAYITYLSKDHGEMNHATKASHQYIANQVMNAIGIPLSAPTVKITRSSGKAKLSWDADLRANSYKVYAATSKTGTYSLVGTTAKSTFTHTKAAAGKTYYYKVKAANTSNDAITSSYSAVKNFTTSCAAPTVTVKSAKKGVATLTWKAVTGASKYQVYRATSKSGTYKLVTTTTKTTYANSKLTSKKKYYFKVKAVNKVTTSANSAYSTVKYVTVK